MLIYSFFSYC